MSSGGQGGMVDVCTEYRGCTEYLFEQTALTQAARAGSGLFARCYAARRVIRRKQRIVTSPVHLAHLWNALTAEFIYLSIYTERRQYYKPTPGSTDAVLPEAFPTNTQQRYLARLHSSTCCPPSVDSGPWPSCRAPPCSRGPPAPCRARPILCSPSRSAATGPC